MDVVRKLILEKLDEKGLKMSEASTRIGRNHAYLQQFLKRGIPAELRERDRVALAELLGVPEESLRGPSPKLSKRDYIKANDERRESLIVTADTRHRIPADPLAAFGATPAAQLMGERDLPVFGTAQGGSGALIVTNQAVDWVVRPDPLLRVRDGYGIIITGDSMAREYNSGDIALVNPHLPPRKGDPCIFRSHSDDGAVHVIIKYYRRETDELWYVSQSNPEKDFTLKKAEWQICHVSVGKFNGR